MSLSDVVEHMRSLTLIEGDKDVNHVTAATATMNLVGDALKGEIDLDALADAAATAVLGTSTEDKKRQQELTRRKETVLQWIFRSVSGGDLIRCETYVLALLPVAFECVRDYDVDLANLAKTMVRYFSRALWWNVERPLAPLSSSAMVVEVGKKVGPVASSSDGQESNIAYLLQILLHLSEHRSWYVRLEAITALSVFNAQHQFLLHPAQSSAILNRIIALLMDERREVQEKAQSILSQLIYPMELNVAAELTQTYLDQAAGTITSKRRKKASSSIGELSAEATAKRNQTQQKCVRFLSALVRAYPYEVPSYVPKTLAVLSRLLHSSISSTLQETIRKTVSDFKRTHQDEWDVNHRHRFSPEELDALNDVLSSPHYYA